MNDMFMNDFDAADPIIIRDPARRRPSQCAMSHEQSRAIKSSGQLSTPICPRGCSGRRCFRSAPSLFNPKDLASRSCTRKKQPWRLNAALRLSRL